MNYEGVHSVILNGFDRSGSSAISRTLAQHPQLELFMQPFNSGPVREKMYHIWSDEIATEEDIAFFRGLENGVLNRDYIRSHWFEQYSTVKDFAPHKLHLVKTTINHFLIDWCQERFPSIHQWAIWRDPWEVLYSLFKNDFSSQWYADALQEIRPAVMGHPSLEEHYGDFLTKDLSAREEIALLIAIRSHYLFRHVSSDRVLFYSLFSTAPQEELGRFLHYYDLSPFSFDATQSDLNIRGARLSSDKRSEAIASWEDVPGITQIFAPLLALMEERFPQRDFRKGSG